MRPNDVVANAWAETLQGINADVFKYSMVKPLPATWVEQNMILPDNTSRYPGRFSYDFTPYWREPINHLHESSPVRYVTILKSVQIGATAGIVIPGILYIIAVDPDNTLFTAGDLTLAKKTIEERLDTILRESKLDSLIRPHAIKKGNQRTGDTAASKEYAGGTLTALGTRSADSFRYFSAKYAFVDDFDTAPRDVGGEGTVRDLIEGRQNSFGDSAKSFLISTPTFSASSNIWDQYQLGTQKKWHWPCYKCGAFMVMDWKIELEDKSYAGIVWTTDGKGKLTKGSVAFRCMHCGELTHEVDKHERNLNGIWQPTVAEPIEEYHESYSTNAIIQPTGFTGWEALVKQWLKANPESRRPNVVLLKGFVNLRLGLPFEEQGDSPKANALMANIGEYHHGIIPDKTCEADGNGKIILVTVCCDLGGLMEKDNEDVRLDYEIVAHAQTGATYSIDQGSIGTFKRAFEKKKTDPENPNRKKWTYTHGSVWVNPETGLAENNCVWPEYEQIIKARYLSDAGEDLEREISLATVDTGFFEKSATQFIINMQDQGYRVYGVKGRTDLKYRPIQRDTKPVRRSAEQPKKLYNLEVNQLKDDLSENMALQKGQDGAQPSGFMNFPQQNDGKYSYNGYFSQFEQEQKIIIKEGETILGYAWKKKHSNSVNHFWDVRVYVLAAVEIYLDLVRQSDPKYKNLTWEEFVIMVTE